MSSSIISITGNILINFKRLFLIAWKRDKKITTGYYLSSMLGALSPLFASITLQYLIDSLLGGYSRNVLSTIPFVVIVVLAVRYVLVLFENIVQWGLSQTYFDNLFRYRIQNELNNLFYKKLSRIDIGHLENSNTQNLIAKSRDTLTWRPPDFLRIFSYFFGTTISYTGAFIILATFAWWVPILITIISLPRLYLRARYGAIQWSIYSSGAPEVKKLWYFTWILCDPWVIREMRIFQSHNYLLDKFRSIQEHLFNLNKKPLDNYLKIISIPPVLETIVIFVIAYLFLPDVLTGVITIGSFTLLINMLDQISSSTSGIVGNIGQIYENNLYVNSYFEVLALPILVSEKRDPVIFKEIYPPNIEFKNVSFSYPGSDLVIRNTSFEINKGESVAFVGVNGAGKSTIIKLICRFYDVTKGEILINGVDIKDISLSNWYQHMGTLFQDFVRYDLTVSENILLGDTKRADKNLIEDAARKSGAYDFIQKLPNKFDQFLGKGYEDGVELSTGQWQKIAIARAFYRSPPLLILDEPTSAIDAESEYEIFNNLEKEYKNKTLILVSHRFSTVRNANKIIVIDNGEIAEQGTHEKLMRQRGKYSRMFTTQAKGYK